MKKLLATMFVALLMAGCGGEPGEDSPESNQSSVGTPPVKPTPVAKIDLDDPATRKRIIAEAIDNEKMQSRGEEGEKLVYAPNQQTPYSGWAKRMYDNGQVKWLHQYKDGKYDGPTTLWLSNGQKWLEHTFKDGWVSRESSVSRRHSRGVISVVGKIFRASLVDKNQ